MSTNLLLFVHTQAGYTPYIQVANAWTGLSTATDILITYVLLYSLSSSLVILHPFGLLLTPGFIYHSGSLTFLLLHRRTGFRSGWFCSVLGPRLKQHLPDTFDNPFRNRQYDPPDHNRLRGICNPCLHLLCTFSPVGLRSNDANFPFLLPHIDRTCHSRRKFP